MDETIITELLEPDHKHDQRGRRITTAAQREALLQVYRKSGLTQRAFAQHEGIKYSTFTSWLSTRRATTASPAPKVSAAPVRFVEATLPAMAAGIEVTLPDGTKLRGGNARELAALIEALRGLR